MYAKRVNEAAKCFKELVDAFVSADEHRAETAVEGVRERWRDAEKLRWDIYTRIVEGQLFFPTSRSDMLALLSYMSQVLHSIHPVNFIVPAKEPLQKEIGHLLTRMAASCADLTGLLALGVEHLNRDPLHALRETRRAVNLKVEIDECDKGIIKHLKGEAIEEIDMLHVQSLVSEISVTVAETLRAISKVQEIAVKYL